MPTALDTNPIIATARAKLFGAVDALGAVPVNRFVPGDIAHLPAAVVYRPAIRPGDTWPILDAELSMVVIGRRYDHDEAHAELDDLADVVITELIRLPGFTFTGCNPVSVSIAGTEFPAYEITVTATAVANC